jgi:chromosome partitioning protein
MRINEPLSYMATKSPLPKHPAPPAPPSVNQVNTLPSPRRVVSMSKIQGLAEHAAGMVEEIRGRLLAPESRKLPPTYSTKQLAALCGQDNAHISYRVTRGDLPAGELSPTGAKRVFRLSEAREWAKVYRADKMRPAGKEAITIAVGNFKGGVAKTTTAMVLAQGLSLRGHRVLVVDTDPQGSLTTLHGILPETEVTEEMTIAPLCEGSETDIRYAIRSTYWDGIDLVSAAPILYQAEFALPARQMQNRNFEFWNVLRDGLGPVRSLYDVIIIDTPPSLSYLTINALWAANGIIVPVPPSGLDFASSAQFWSLLSDLGLDLDKRSGAGGKVFDFLHVLLSRVDSGDVAMPVVRSWIQATYGEYLLPVEIPKTSVTSNKAAEFATVYDGEKYEGSAKTYKRAAEAYDAFVDLIEQSIGATWNAS